MGIDKVRLECLLMAIGHNFRKMVGRSVLLALQLPKKSSMFIYHRRYQMLTIQSEEKKGGIHSLFS